MKIRDALIMLGLVGRPKAPPVEAFDPDVAPKGWTGFTGRDGATIAIPADLEQEALMAELIDASTIYDKEVVWQGNHHWVVSLDTIRAMVQIAHATRDPDMALIEISNHLLDWSGSDESEFDG